MVKTKAIVLFKKDFNDYDSLVYFYTLDFGKISLIARGIKRPSAKLSGHLEPFNLVDLMIIKGRERDYVGSAISEDSFLNIKDNYLKTFLAGSAIKLLKDFTFPNQSDFNIFLVLKDFLLTLNSLESNDDVIKSLFIFFKIKFFAILGYDFDFSICSLCGQKDPNFFNFFNKEVVCSNCLNIENSSPSNFIKINKTVLNLKKNIISSEFFEFNNLNINREQGIELDNFIEIIRKIV